MGIFAPYLIMGSQQDGAANFGSLVKAFDVRSPPGLAQRSLRYSVAAEGDEFQDSVAYAFISACLENKRGPLHIPL